MLSLQHARTSPTPRLRSLASLVALCVLAWLGLACPTGGVTWPEDGQGFDDHSFPSLAHAEQFHGSARRSAAGTEALKFIIVGFGRERDETLRFLDGQFYEFHDQWYWYRLVNGFEIPGARVRPLQGHSFTSVAQIQAWFEAQQPEALDLRVLDDGRLYSQHFYDLAVRREPRRFGAGTLVYFPPREQDPKREAVWGFELEYGDNVDAEELERFFALLREALPPELATQLRFIARSPHHERVVAQLRRAEHALTPHLMTYAELAVPGEVQVYSPGLVAGRLRKLPSEPELAAAALTTGDPEAIWVMPSVPDELPPAAGLITAVPQTPLAHVNLLARNRGIPNLYLGGAVDDPQLEQLARIHAPVVLLAESSGQLRIEAISDQEYARYRMLLRTSTTNIAPLDVTELAYTLAIEPQLLSRLPELRRSIGGKAAGFIALARAGVTMPARPLAISVRAYAEHISELRPVLEDLLRDPTFHREARARYLLLEGRDDFDRRFPGARDQAWAATFIEAHPAARGPRDPIAEFLARGGVKRALRELPLAPAFEGVLREALHAHFGALAASQGLRFRSSSSVEDIEGFSGAGLYDSNTGYLQPPAGSKKSVAWALRRTWASYWSWEAFEERRMAQIDHLAGNMAVLVHPRFDDPFELANGVMTLTLDRRGRAGVPALEMLVDVQDGALSVTNPPPERAGEVLPEVDRLTRATPAGPAKIERLASSTEHPTPILSDAALTALLDDATRVALYWLEAEALTLAPAQLRRRVTLDFEFRVVAPGWPAYADVDADADAAADTRTPERLVLKQVRSLDPGVPPGARALATQPIPRELLDFATRVERKRCRGARSQLELLELWTDPMHPTLGHAQLPFVAALSLAANGLGPSLRQLERTHLELGAVHHDGLAAGGPWSIAVELTEAELSRIEHAAGLLRLKHEGRLLREEPAACQVEVLFAAPDEFLRALLEQQPSQAR